MALNEVRVCHFCGTEFPAVQYAQKFCSTVCGYRFRNALIPRKPKVASNCVRCGADLADKRANAIYCSKTCKCMDHTFKRRGSTRLIGTVRRRAIIERDGGVCYMCGTHLPVNEVHLDHLIPVAMGGSSDSGNIAVACGRCNRSRGAKMSITQVLKRNQIRSSA